MNLVALLLLLSVKVQLPPDVHTVGCNVHQVQVMVHGNTPVHYDVWEAEAFALVDKQAFADTDHRWSVGRFPDNPKGRRRAWKACDEFIEEAERILKDMRSGR
jgi:uncharacterized paraquat-inducible protein A